MKVFWYSFLVSIFLMQTIQADTTRAGRPTLSPRQMRQMETVVKDVKKSKIDKAGENLRRIFEERKRDCERTQGCFLTQETVDELETSYGFQRISQTEGLLNRCLREDQPLYVHSERNQSTVTLFCDGGRFSSSEMPDSVVYTRVDACARYYDLLLSAFEEADADQEREWTHGVLGGTVQSGACRPVSEEVWEEILSSEYRGDCVAVPCGTRKAERSPDGSYCFSRAGINTCPNWIVNTEGAYGIEPPLLNLRNSTGGSYNLCTDSQKLMTASAACKNTMP